MRVIAVTQFSVVSLAHFSLLLYLLVSQIFRLLQNLQLFVVSYVASPGLRSILWHLFYAYMLHIKEGCFNHLAKLLFLGPRSKILGGRVLIPNCLSI